MKIRISDSPQIAVVGHLVKDELLSASGSLTIALGGTAYNLATLAAVQDTGNILPVCRLGYDIRCLADRIFARSPRFDLSLVCNSNRPSCVHRLQYRSDGSREEWNSGRQEPLLMEPGLARTDAILMNFISGSDVRLSDFRIFRKRYHGLIYLDYHSLSLGMKNNIRFLRRHPKWREYLALADMVQMNLAELGSIFERPFMTAGGIVEASRAIMEYGPSAVIVTCDRNGVIAVQRDGSAYKVPALSVPREIDPTGCGDTLSATFVHGLIRTGNFIESLERANRHAAGKATFSGIDDFIELEKILGTLGPPTRAEYI